MTIMKMMEMQNKMVIMLMVMMMVVVVVCLNDISGVVVTAGSLYRVLTILNPDVRGAGGKERPIRKWPRGYIRLEI